MKKVKRLLVAFFCVFALTGCYKVNVEINVGKDLKAEGTMEVLMKKGLGATSKDLINQMKESNSDLEVLDKDIKRTIDGDEYIGIKVGAENFTDLFPGATVKEKDGKIELSIPFGSLDDELSSSSEDFDPETAEAMGVDLTLTVNMPGKITSAKDGEINGNSVTYNLFSIKQNTIKVVSEKGSDYTTIIIFGVIAVAAVAVGLVLFKMRKNKNNNDESSSESGNETLMQEPTKEKP